MIYTLGRTVAYDEALAHSAEPMKLGQRQPCAEFPRGYEGGSVWETRAQAQAYVDSLPNELNPTWNAVDFSVYAVDADWETDTYQVAGAAWRSLLYDRRIISMSAAEAIESAA
jgi:hypothetical protein